MILYEEVIKLNVQGQFSYTTQSKLSLSRNNAVYGLAHVHCTVYRGLGKYKQNGIKNKSMELRMLLKDMAQHNLQEIYYFCRQYISWAKSL